MTTAIFYTTSIVISVIGICAVWQLGLKPLMLDNFRDSLFFTRDRLYALAREGRIDCDSDAYRAVEQFINSVIRYAHRFTFMSFILWSTEANRLKIADEQAAPAIPLSGCIGALDDPALRTELSNIVQEILILLPRYIAKSSLMFIVGSAIYLAFRSVSPFIARSKQQAVESYEAGARTDWQVIAMPALRA